LHLLTLSWIPSVVKYEVQRFENSAPSRFMVACACTLTGTLAVFAVCLCL
jgi:hypothetical protein